MGQCPCLADKPKNQETPGNNKETGKEVKTPKAENASEDKDQPPPSTASMGTTEPSEEYLKQKIASYTTFPKDDYQFMEKLGEGSFGHVYRVRRKSDNEMIACKVIDYSKFGVKALENIREEVKALKKLKHKNICTFYGNYQHPPERVYILMEMCTGGELYDRMVADNKTVKLTENIVSDYIKQILDVLSYIHGLGIVHCDLKPENCIFVSRDSHELRVFDFGFAQQRKSVGTFGKLQGTPMYIAPEALKKQYTETFDMWSVGIMTFEMLHGYAPFQANNPMRIIKKAAKGFNPIDKPSKGPHFNSKIKISSNAKSFITSLLKLKPSERITANEALQHPWITEDETFLVDNSVVQQLDHFARLHVIQKCMIPFMLEEAKKMNQFLLDKLAKTFEKFDSDQSGEIDFQEFIALIAQVEEKTRSKEENLGAFQSIDTDGSGQISKEEFLQWYAWEYVSKQDERFWNLIETFDENGDGYITLDEINSKLLSNPSTKDFVDSPAMQGFHALFKDEEKIDIKELCEIIKMADQFDSDDTGNNMKEALQDLRNEPSGGFDETLKIKASSEN